MKRSLRAVAVVLGALWILLSIAPAAASEPTIMRASAPCERAVHLGTGDLATCDGDQVPTAWLLALLTDRHERRRLAQDLVRAEERRELELAAATQRHDAERRRLTQDLARAEERRRVEVASLAQEREAEHRARLEAERAQAPPPPPPPPDVPIWRQPAWIFLGGLLVGAGLSLAVVVATR